MKSKIKLLSLIICCLFSSASFAQVYGVTKPEALAIAQRQFQGRDVDYFILEDTNTSYWTIFVDAEPMKGWEHECYVLTISKSTPTSIANTPPRSMEQRTLPPAGNYVPLSVKNRYGKYVNLKPAVAKSPQSNTDTGIAQRTYAIILSGGVNKLSNYERYWNDCSFIYQTLTNRYGLPKENIFPIMSDGNDPAEDMRRTGGGYASQSLDLDNDGINEIQLAATKSNIQNTLNALSQKLQQDDHLFLYVIDHGGTVDGNTNSYICLWNNERLMDTELASMLNQFTTKFVNVNVVLGQCYSGGFNDNLTKIGCVVAAASTGSESSWSCPDIPYDEFVYQWTCAVNGADHKNLPVYADTDDNGHISMLEAFEYAQAHDRISMEHPQYVSTPTSVGEDLAFNHIAESVDLYIKDNPEDTGKEPNKTTNEFWKSPSIWVRNQDDDIEIHENPVYSPNHLAALVCVKIHNRGKKAYTGGQWLHVYWSKASTGFSNKAWKGRELYNNQFVTGGHLEAVHIPPIQAGDSTTVKVTWALPQILISENENDRHHFCLMTKIMSTHFDEKYEDGKSYFDVQGSNDQAQKNVSIIPKSQLPNATLLFVRNVSNTQNAYSLELVPKSVQDEVLYDRANIEMELSPVIYTAWERGGFKSHDISAPTNQTNDVDLRTVRFLSSKSKLEDLTLMGEEFDRVSLKFNFKQFSNDNTSYTFDLIQKDENGNIIGGETFIVESPSLLPAPLDIDASQTENGQIQLSVRQEEFSNFRWTDQQENTVGYTDSIVVTPTLDNDKYTVVAFTPDGDVATESISLNSTYGIKSVVPSPHANEVVVQLNSSPIEKSIISIISTSDGKVIMEKSLESAERTIAITTPDLNPGIFAVVYSADGTIIDQKKFTLR